MEFYGQTLNFNLINEGHYQKFHCFKSIWQLTDINESFEGGADIIDLLINTLKIILNNHKNIHQIPDDRSIVHLGIHDEGFDFFFHKVGKKKVTLGDCLYGNGLDIITEYFRLCLNSNQVIKLSNNTKVKVYTYTAPSRHYR